MQAKQLTADFQTSRCKQTHQSCCMSPAPPYTSSCCCWWLPLPVPLLLRLLKGPPCASVSPPSEVVVPPPKLGIRNRSPSSCSHTVNNRHTKQARGNVGVATETSNSPCASTHGNLHGMHRAFDTPWEGVAATRRLSLLPMTQPHQSQQCCPCAASPLPRPCPCALVGWHPGWPAHHSGCRLPAGPGCPHPHRLQEP